MSRHLGRRAALRSLPWLMTPAAMRLHRALVDPRSAQDAMKRRVAADMARTAYGREHGVRGPEDFAALPVADFASLAPWLEAQRANERQALCAEPVQVYERTSGSSGAAKLIPYTASLRGAFSEMFAAWAWDLLNRGPKLRTGKLWISASPAIGAPQRTAIGTRIGLDDDVEYLEPWLQHLLRPFLVGPRHSRHASAEAFKDAVSIALIAEPDLEIVSVWNPTFFEVMLDHIAVHRRRLAREVPAHRRAALLAGDEPVWPALWPALRLVSCWDQGAAEPMARRLARRLPQALVQGKGLLATEGPVTLPWLHAGGAVPLAHRTVVELRDGQGLRDLADAEVGATYEVVISPIGGLPRYTLGDRVQVTHRYHRTPVLRFVGRSGGVSDLVGEKLQEAFVEEALHTVLPPSEGLRTLVPLPGPPARYALLTDEAVPRGLASRVDRALSEAHHYGLARSLGQLAPLTVATSPRAGQWVAEREMRRGLKWGDIKPRALQTHPADAEFAELIASTGAL